jgi:anti-sigma B factor antagonist
LGALGQFHLVRTIAQRSEASLGEIVVVTPASAIHFLAIVRAVVSLLDLQTETQGDAVRIVLSGELDISTAPRVEEELQRVEADQPAVIVLDLRELEFMDSTGLRVIVSADGRARDDGRSLRLVRGPEAVQRIFRVTRLDERLEIGDDPEALTQTS